MTNQESIIRFENVTKQYDSDDPILKSVSLKLREVNSTPCLDLPAAERRRFFVSLPALPSRLKEIFILTAALLTGYRRMNVRLIRCFRIMHCSLI